MSTLSFRHRLKCNQIESLSAAMDRRVEEIHNRLEDEGAKAQAPITSADQLLASVPLLVNGLSLPADSSQSCWSCSQPYTMPQDIAKV